ncbi:MAG: enoyl-CoA hydratase-related protein [Caulobacteraceae bacterium]|nr:enoyl-CoA hydratase-related protein [Caulobacteraceae bacterium]
MPNPISDPLVENIDTDADSDRVLIEATEEGAVTVWINRPQRRNAFDSTTIAALREAFETLHAQDGVRIVFVRGAGGVFCAGADLDWMREAAILTEDDNHADAMELAMMLKTLHELRPLTVALVEAAAFGGGAGLAAACDIAVATADAKFAFSEVKLGLTPATISPYVVAAVGPRVARGLFATARVFDAAYAEKVGLVQEVVADAAALEAVQARLATEILACAPGAVGHAKRLVDDVWAAPLDHALLEDTARRIARARVSPEGREGVDAFLNKRKPSWAGQ